VNELATTIPDVATDAVTPTGRLSARGGPRSVFPECQRSFSPSAVFPAVIPHFCCRAVMDWPRATFLLTMTLRSLDVNQAARANCLGSAILVVAPFYESEQLGSQTRTALLTSKPGHTGKEPTSSDFIFSATWCSDASGRVHWTSRVITSEIFMLRLLR
jgi:hypothetical protein